MGKTALFIARLIDEGRAKVKDLAKALSILQHAIAFSSGKAWNGGTGPVPSLPDEDNGGGGG